jgi:hypothetical protein
MYRILKLIASERRADGLNSLIKPGIDVRGCVAGAGVANMRARYQTTEREPLVRDAQPIFSIFTNAAARQGN